MAIEIVVPLLQVGCAIAAIVLLIAGVTPNFRDALRELWPWRWFPKEPSATVTTYAEVRRRQQLNALVRARLRGEAMSDTRETR